MGGVPTRAHRPCHIDGMLGGGECEARIFFL